jgi:hypothetical protein
MLPNAWWKSWLAWLAIGVVLFVWAGLALMTATRQQQAEQQRRDAHWAEVNAIALRSNPPMLPGEKKPAPAPLEGRWLIALLAIAATGAVGRGGWLWLERLRALWSPPGEESAGTPFDRDPSETGPGQRGPMAPTAPLSRGSHSPGPPPAAPTGAGTGTPTGAPPTLRGEPPFRPIAPPTPPLPSAPRPAPPGARPGDHSAERRND